MTGPHHRDAPALTPLTPGALDALVAFIEAHPAPGAPALEAKRFLTSLVRGPDAVLARPSVQAPSVVASLIDTCENTADSAELLLLGCGPDGAHELPALLDDGVRAAKLGPRRALDVTLREEGPWTLAMLHAAGFRYAYTLHELTRPITPEDLTIPPPGSLPAGLRWTTLGPERAADYRLLVRAAMSGVEGTLFPPEADFLANTRLFASTGRIHVLVDDRALSKEPGMTAQPPLCAFVRVSVDARAHLGELRILGRAPAYRALGLGPHVVARGLRAVAEAGARTAELSVAASNPRALALYERCGFQSLRATHSFRCTLR